ncbi:hypothetical protein A4G19_12715 [Pasteurellaceae bacterium Macca]|nr:hypothetical protein [Pasteurellaceae bacterium Macca]
MGFSLLVLFSVICIIWEDRKAKNNHEEQRYNEYMAKLDKELSRPIIKERLFKQQNKPIEVKDFINGSVNYVAPNGKETKIADIKINLK